MTPTFFEQFFQEFGSRFGFFLRFFHFMALWCLHKVQLNKILLCFTLAWHIIKSSLAPTHAHTHTELALWLQTTCRGAFNLAAETWSKVFITLSGCLVIKWTHLQSALWLTLISIVHTHTHSHTHTSVEHWQLLLLPLVVHEIEFICLFMNLPRWNNVQQMCKNTERKCEV